VIVSRHFRVVDVRFEMLIILDRIII